MCNPGKILSCQKCYGMCLIMWSYILKMLFNVITAFSFILDKFMNSFELREGERISCDFFFFFLRKRPESV